MHSVTSQIAQKRLLQDFKKLHDHSPEGMNFLKKQQEYLQRPKKIICLFGKELYSGIFGSSYCVSYSPEDTPWEGGIYQLEMKFPQEYPNKPPTVQFLTSMFHPNIFENGFVCVDILRDHWSPVIDVEAVLLSVQVFS